MTTSISPVAAGPAQPPSFRGNSLAAGTLYLLTFASIPTLFLYGQVKEDPSFIAGAGPDHGIVLGGILEVLVALACIGTAVALYPVVRRQNEALALGFVSMRILEAAAIFAGVVALMSIVTLREAGVGADGILTGQALLAQHTWTTLLGQGLIPAINALLLGPLMFRSRLLPRVLPVFGFIGAPFLIIGAVGVLLGLWGPASPVSAIAALCLTVWEFGMGIYLVTKGFRRGGVARLAAANSQANLPVEASR